ncbi:hypothetical protein O181_102394, partial [Austropuccinia psidii MF-1]|nr:hypothetical protein [Austropuccinia psidii MF-1]
AKANLKRVTDQNRNLLQPLYKILIGSNIIHLLSILIFKSNRLATRYTLYYLLSSLIGYSCYSFLFSSSGLSTKTSKPAKSIPDDVSAGFHQYLLDYCYLSSFIWVTTGLISHSFWKLYIL